ncbi:MAG: proteasome accessory factor PafA2 family protein [Leptospiraceae bacterium]|nr:proteasome accessory factor PafA2 family protein [Leptospiraceae bacterium]
MGLETEYAIRFSSNVIERPDNRIIYDSILKYLNDYTKTISGTSIIKWGQIFLENGSSICYECLPNHLESGLLEAATPETTNPIEVVLYQRAIDKLLKKSLQKINSSNISFANSTISLIKNCKDAYQNVYGAQENYSASVANDITYKLYRLFIYLYIPLLAIYIFGVFLLSFIILLIQSILLIVLYFFYLTSKAFGQTKYHTYDFFYSNNNRSFFQMYEKISGIVLSSIEIVFSYPMIFPFITIFNLIAFRPYKKNLLAFLITRIILTGSGTIEKNGTFYLSEKALFTKRVSRTTNLPSERCIYDSGNILKLSYLAVLSLFKLNVSYFLQLIKKEQRLQIGMSDSCMCEEAELLKVGTTALILDMIDQQYLKESPQIEKPIKFLEKINQYPNFFNQKAIIKNHESLNTKKEMTAIEIQKWYLEKAKDFLRTKVVQEPEYQLIIKIWEEILFLIEQKDWQSLFGRIDWVTKKNLIEEVLLKEIKQHKNHNKELVDFKEYLNYYELLKTIDIKYHDLYNGYYYKLEELNLAKRIFSDEEIEHAMNHPPNDDQSFAKIRSLIIKKLHSSYHNVRMSWNFIQVGDSLISKIIPLKDYQKEE